MLKIKNKIQNFKKKFYCNRKFKIQSASYPLDIYSNLLLQLKQKNGIQFCSFKQNNEASNKKINIYNRHDIDTKDCINSLSKIIDIDEKFKIPSSIYFRVDEVEYSLKDFRQQIISYKEKGFEIGLHTTCYLKENSINEFKNETKKFIAELSFAPSSFSIHGTGTHQNSLKNFTTKIVNNYENMGYEFSDCIPLIFKYDYVIEDCHFDNVIKKRFIYNDFIKPPFFFKKNSNYLILTHPCYWC